MSESHILCSRNSPSQQNSNTVRVCTSCARDSGMAAGVQGRLGDEDFKMSAEEATRYLQTLGSKLGEAARRLRDVQRQHTVKEAELRANQQQQRQVRRLLTRCEFERTQLQNFASILMPLPSSVSNHSGTCEIMFFREARSSAFFEPDVRQALYRLCA